MPRAFFKINDSFNDIHELKCGQAEEKLEAGGDEKFYLALKYHFNLSLSLVGSGSLSISLPLFSQLDSLSRHSSSRLIARTL